MLDLIGGTVLTPPATFYVALYTAGTLTDASTGDVPLATEVAAADYERLAIANTVANFPAASGNPSQKTNANLHLFEEAVEDWGTITQWALVDAVTGGNIWYFGSFQVSKLIQAGDVAQISPGSIKITED